MRTVHTSLLTRRVLTAIARSRRVRLARQVAARTAPAFRRSLWCDCLRSL